MQEHIIATIPQGSADTALEVALLQDERKDVYIELRCLAWGTGVGWYRQHTLKLDRLAAQALLRTLGYVRSRLDPVPLSGQIRKVIPLPCTGPAQAALQHPALHPSPVKVSPH
jgi:hypothetical protein